MDSKQDSMVTSAWKQKRQPEAGILPLNYSRSGLFSTTCMKPKALPLSLASLSSLPNPPKSTWLDRITDSMTGCEAATVLVRAALDSITPQYSKTPQCNVHSDAKPLDLGSKEAGPQREEPSRNEPTDRWASNSFDKLAECAVQTVVRNRCRPDQEMPGP